MPRAAGPKLHCLQGPDQCLVFYSRSGLFQTPWK